MKLADATCAPGPPRLRYMLAEPRTSPSSETTTETRPGADTIQVRCPSVSTISRS
jgi:hypothetical protein